jgi:hypothetical protein
MTELFSILTNCDDSMLELNSILDKKGFEVIKIPVPELEKNYKFLFGLPEKYTYTGTIGFPNGVVTDTFFNVFQSAEFIDDWQRDFVIAIKSNVGHIKADEDDWFGFKRFAYIESFTKNLIDNLRLFKEGDIEVGCYFTFDCLKKNGDLYSLRRALFTENLYTIDKNEIDCFYKIFFNLEIKNELAKKVKLYFDQSYKINHPEIRYILLVTALESVLNSNKEQISHTFARHLALIISNDKLDFKINYQKIKKLYNYRSEIVHGVEYKKESLKNNIKELRQYVRQTIVFINKFNPSNNKELFEYLNSKGYE